MLPGDQLHMLGCPPHTAGRYWRCWLRACAACLIILVTCDTLPTGAASSTSNNAAFPAVIRPVLPRLGQAKIPVFLPTWLPSVGRRMYPEVALTHHGMGYELLLWGSPTDRSLANRFFFVSGVKGQGYQVTSTTVPVRLHDGNWAYVDVPTGPMGFTTIYVPKGIRNGAFVDQYTYALGWGPLDRRAWSPLIHMARSLRRLRGGTPSFADST